MIDDPDDPNASGFPLSQRWVVRFRLKRFFEDNAVSRLVCSGTGGADLLALEIAANLNIHCTLMLPADEAAFKKTMIANRPGDWGKILDKVTKKLLEKDDVKRVSGPDMEAVMDAILSEAERQGEKKGEEVMAVLAWERPQKKDYLSYFREKAEGFKIAAKDVRTDRTPTDIALEVLNEGARGQSFAEVRDLYEELRIVKGFNYARRILGLYRRDPNLFNDRKLKIDQLYALAIYKDVDLPVALRLEEALRVLKQIPSSADPAKERETLSLIGAVYKRKWEADGQPIDLQYSYAYYKKAYDLGPEGENGYPGLNAAFILDLMAYNERLAIEQMKDECLKPEQQAIADKYGEEALELRKTMVKALVKKYNRSTEKFTAEEMYWRCATIAEAYYGLCKYRKAGEWLELAVADGSVPDWQLESTARQFAQIVLLRPEKDEGNIQDSEAWNVLKALTKREENEDVSGALKAVFLGKVGLALSGGGFRAALYHIGVLARLAELDMLRNVEVLSCVSGGSIIGAHYYLELKNLLEEKEDADIDKGEYIQIVKRISGTFLDGVKTNIRMRVISNWWDNTRLFWDKGYSRSLRLGKLYEEKIFKRVRGYEDVKQIMLNELKICPKMGGIRNPSFNPKYDNWRRKAKVPILLLNATTVNTGHNWQFSTTWMGESPFAMQKIDANARLRRMYYKTTGEKKYRREIRLGYAVAASSAVPGLFDPLKLKTLYPGYKVSLVDGGVHDNQGIAGLLEQDCTVMLVSDASGQMVTINQVGDNILAVPLRSNDILMERVRNAEYQELATRRRAGLLKGFMFIHLKMELDIETVNWIHCEDPQEVQTLDNPEITITTYHVRKDLQRMLSNIRTDLDSFNDTEAHALMASGYLMTAKEYGNSIKGFTRDAAPQEDWAFLEIASELKDVDANDETIRLLDTGSKMLFKIWSLNDWLRWTARVLGGVVILLVGYLFIKYWKNSIKITVSGIGIGLVTYVAGMFINKWLIDLARLRETAIRLLVMTALVTVLWVVVNLHLLFFDRLYLRVGRRPGR